MSVKKGEEKKILCCCFPFPSRYCTQTATIQYNFIAKCTIALGMFCGAKYTHHTFMPIIKHN